MYDFTLGADPELFLINTQSGKFISAIGKIGGTKQHPQPIGEGCAIQEDNVAVEFNIAPSDTKDQFINGINYALAHLVKKVQDNGLSLSVTASHSFDEDQLRHPLARRFGCDPDFNAWTGRRNKPPTTTDKNLRSAGGHVHFGTPLDRMQIIRWSDVAMGLWSVLEDTDLRRRELYWKAGAFRMKPYGCEYRTLSCYWIASNDAMEKIWERAKWAVNKVVRGHTLENDEEGKLIQTAINNSNKNLAETLLKKYDAICLQ